MKKMVINHGMDGHNLTGECGQWSRCLLVNFTYMCWFECWKYTGTDFHFWMSWSLHLTKQPWGSIWNPEDCFSKEVFHQMFWLHMTCPLGFSADGADGEARCSIHSCWPNCQPRKMMIWDDLMPRGIVWIHWHLNFDPSPHRTSVKLWHWGILFYLAAGQGKLLASTSIWPPHNTMDVFWIMVPLLVYVNIALFVSWFAPMETLGPQTEQWDPKNWADFTRWKWLCISTKTTFLTVKLVKSTFLRVKTQILVVKPHFAVGGGWILLAVVWNLGNVFEHGV